MAAQVHGAMAEDIALTKRIVAIGFIWICTTLAWFILAGTISDRTNSSSAKLDSKVGSTWGTPQVQSPPTAKFWTKEEKKTEIQRDGKKTVQTELVDASYELPLAASRIDVNLDLRHRQKGLLWYSTYTVRFAGNYAFTNTSQGDQKVFFRLPFPAEQAMYDDLRMEVDGVPVPQESDGKAVTVAAVLKKGQTVTLTTGYRSQGMDSWAYKFDEADVAHARDFELNMRTNFPDIDFPSDALSPTTKEPIGKGWKLTWKFANLVSGFHIGMTMPDKLQPGPLAGQISYFAPVSLLFFFFVMFILTTLRGIELHPMNYFFLACAFFAFHLLLAYSVDHISIHAAFAMCSLVSVFLVVSYLRLVVGMRFAAVEAGGAQLIYLVLFSCAFFFKGFTGLAITIGAIVSLFVAMQATGRIRWSERFELGTPARQPL